MPNLFLAPVIGDKGKWYQKREQFVLFILAEFRITKPELGVFFFFFLAEQVKLSIVNMNF